jgi:hypothetical protein
MYQAIEVAKENIVKVQAKKEHDVNPHRRPVDFKAGDRVYILTKKTDRPSHKLDNQLAGPFLIIRQVGHSFKVQLLDYMKIRNVFLPDKL